MPHARKTHTWLAFLLALLLALVVAAACSDPDEDGEPDPGSITPLPKTAFVYIKYPRASNVGHIYSYDLATKKDTLISKLDDNGITGTSSPDVALSPDRRWIALRAFFRPEAKDTSGGLTIPSIWKLSVDGKLFKRLTAPIPNPNTITCTHDAQCPKPMTCLLYLKRCAPQHFTIGLSSPTWSADNKTIYTALSQHWTSAGKMAGGAVLASVPATGGTLATHYTATGCAQTTNPVAHPKQGTIAAIHSVCSGGVPGLYKYGMPPTSKPTRMFSSTEVSAELGTMAWMPDGSFLYFNANAKWDLDGDKVPETTGYGIVGLKVSTGELGGLLPPLKTGSTYSGIAMSPTGNEMAVCVFDSNAKTYKIYLLDAANKKATFSELIGDGKSCNPSW